MNYTFTGIFEKGEKYYIGYCVEIPEANGQGESIEECRQSLIEAIKLVIEDRKNDIMTNVPSGMIEEIRIQWKEDNLWDTYDDMDVMLKEKAPGIL